MGPSLPDDQNPQLLPPGPLRYSPDNPNIQIPYPGSPEQYAKPPLGIEEAPSTRCQPSPKKGPTGIQKSTSMAVCVVQQSTPKMPNGWYHPTLRGARMYQKMHYTPKEDTHLYPYLPQNRPISLR
ncbi:hypothetical protein G9A89_000718 [Geosiphon pyriformis]|nr:hypothetical protein G9A89_000718 [Geosiphon pyriformis]